MHTDKHGFAGVAEVTSPVERENDGSRGINTPSLGRDATHQSTSILRRLSVFIRVYLWLQL